MNKNSILDHITTFGTKELIIGSKKRLCYLIKCKQCDVLHYKAEHELMRGIRRHKMFFCNEKCRNNYYSTAIEVNCANCTKQFMKVPSQISKSKSGNVFCNKSCAAKYNNRHKKYGTRRSKLEKYIEGQINVIFPTLDFECNSISVIGSELDFYFPKLKLAIQINGIFHFIPIFGSNRLLKIQKLDNEKRDKCSKMNIKLIEIDVSADKTYNEKNKIMRWIQIKNILEQHI